MRIILHFCRSAVDAEGDRTGTGAGTSDGGLHCDERLRFFGANAGDTGANAGDTDMSLAVDASNEVFNDTIEHSGLTW